MNCKTIYRVNQEQHSTGDAITLHPESLSNVQLSHQSHRFHIFLVNQADKFRIYRDHMANVFGVSVRTIQRWVNELKEAGLMVYHRRKMTMKADDGFYMVFELRPERMNTIREKLKKTAKKAKKLARKLMGQQEALDDPKALFDECIERLSQSHQLSNSDINYLEMVFNDWYDTLTAQPRPQDAYKWMERAHQIHMTEQRNTMKLVQAKDEKSNALVAQIRHEATVIRSQHDPRAWDGDLDQANTAEAKNANVDIFYGEEDEQDRQRYTTASHCEDETIEKVRSVFDDMKTIVDFQ